jgi:dihydrofolate reductase
MNKIIANFFISMDGVVESPHEWHFPYHDADLERVIDEGQGSQAAFLMGRTLYDGWAEYWPAQGPDAPFSSYINGIRKYVITHRPIEGELWNNTTVLGADPVEQVRELKETLDGDIATSGSATTVRWLLAHGLLDELNLTVHPIAIGTGQRLFEDTGTVPLTLVHSEAFASGVLHVRYAPAPKA